MVGDERLKPVIAAMRAAVSGRGSASDELYRHLQYQMGWADEHGNPVDARTGKGIRPLICLIACQAVGGDYRDASVPAAAIELTHEFSLVHDDIEDGDRLRRGRATLWSLVGEPLAINAGDALFGLARQLLSGAHLRDSTVLEVMRRYDRACVLLAEGQHMDLTLESADDVAVDEYIEMVRRKTGALVAAAAAIGAVVGDAHPDVVDILAHFGESLGVAFQMQDDVLGLWGSEEITGKPAGRDLQRRKKSMPVVLALRDPDLGPEVRELFSAEEPNRRACEQLASRLDEAGIRARTVSEAKSWSDRGRSALAAVGLADGPRAELGEMLHKAIERDR
jgi:geranylgeranyl diphosphate synthase type I